MIKDKWYRYKQKCNNDLKRNYYYMQYKGVIHDGMSENYVFSAFDILYPLFVLTGLSIFMYILINWTRIKDKIRNGK